MKLTVVLAVLLIAAANLSGHPQELGNTNTFVEIDRSAIPEKTTDPVTSPLEAPKFERYIPRGIFSLRYENLRQTPTEFTPLIEPSKELSIAPKQKVDNSADVPDPVSTKFDWSAAVQQSLIFLAVQHGYAIGGQSKTRESLKGPFFRDYFSSVKSLSGWGDGGRFFTNYVAHPMEGSFTGFIQVQNDPLGKGLRISNTKAYWKSRAKAMAWSAFWSTQFEIGPISQASIGNVGHKGKQTYVDIVVTPTVGTMMLVVEDAIDQYVIRRIENWTKNSYVKIFARMLLNPTRTMANVIRFELPWLRDPGLR